MRLAGLRLENYRSIGAEGVLLQPIRKCSVLVGQNNVGKSNVLRAIQRASALVAALRPRRGAGHAVGSGKSFDLANSYRKTGQPFKMVLYFEFDAEGELEDLLRPAIPGGAVEFQLEANPGEKARVVNSTFHDLSRNHQDVRRTHSDFTVHNDLQRKVLGTHYSSQPPKEEMNRRLGEIGENLFHNRFAQLVPAVEIIPEFRQIQVGESYGYNGTSLVAELARFQHPPEGQDELRSKFDAIERFTQMLLHMPDARLEVTHGNDEILLTNDGLRLALSSYGTGIHQLVILLTAVLTMTPKSICCIEEPEIHLHPRLQREFLRFLITETDLTFVLSTHSAALINTAEVLDSGDGQDVQIHHVSVSAGNGTTSRPVLEDEESLEALRDLGLKASDLLQANCVIWVEGPSDRVYINHWLRLVNPELVEGLHYSIMLYGGSLLKYVDAQRDPPLVDLIRLLKINQNIGVVMDSDRSRPGAHVDKTKRRVQAELESIGRAGHCWITDGREIENYLPNNVLEEFLQDHLGRMCSPSLGKYDRLEEILDTASRRPGSQRMAINYLNDKIGYAKKICSHFALANIGPELDARLRGLNDFIKASNSP